MRVKRQDDEMGAHGGASRVDGACRVASVLLACGLGIGLASACGGTSSSDAGKPQTPSGGSGAGVTGDVGTAAKTSGMAGTATGGQVNGSQGGVAPGLEGGEGGMPGLADDPVLGRSCAPPGALACAGHHQKLALVCSGAGVWDVNQTCPSGQFCDSTEGADHGVCKVPDSDCAARQPGEAFCAGTDGKDAIQCDPDGLAAEVVEQCTDRCVEGKCAAAPPCPDNIAYSCDPQCPGEASQTLPACFDLCPAVPTGRSPVLDISVGVKSAIRLPAVPTDTPACSCEESSLGALDAVAFQLPEYASGNYWHITYPETWNLHWYADPPSTEPRPKNEYTCLNLWPFNVSETPGCAVIPTGLATGVWMSTDMPVPSSATAFVELVNSAVDQCPP